LARKQSGEVQESLRTSGKSSLLKPVRFGQLAHERSEKGSNAKENVALGARFD